MRAIYRRLADWLWRSVFRSPRYCGRISGYVYISRGWGWIYGYGGDVVVIAAESDADAATALIGAARRLRFEKYRFTDSEIRKLVVDE